jgi:hypothetical protein
MFLIRLKNFLNALWFHIWSGFPKTTKLELLERYKICQSCEWLNKNQKECNICGCLIDNKRMFFNKLAWADQECPVGRWYKIKRN